MRAMFSTVAPRYDFITRAFSYGMDRHWKRLGVERARLPRNPVVLDLASGTGDFSLLAARAYPGARTVTVDLTERMLQLARGRGLSDAVCADAGRLPFASHTFDCVFIGYGLRNFRNLRTAVAEIERVTRPGGLLVSLDFFLPANRAAAPPLPGLPLRPGHLLGLRAAWPAARLYVHPRFAAQLRLHRRILFAAPPLGLRRGGRAPLHPGRHRTALGGQTRNRMKDRLRPRDYRFLAVCLALLIGSVWYSAGNFYRAFPEASIDFRVSREDAAVQARALLPSLGFRAQGYREASSFNFDDDAKTFLEREVGLEQANQLMGTRVRLWRWSYRWFRPQQKEEFRVDITPRGELVGFNHDVPEALPLPAIAEPAARAMAEDCLRTRMRRPPDSLEFVELSEQVRPHRVDRFYTWKERDFNLHDATYRVEVEIDGDQVAQYREYLKIPEQWKRDYQRLRSKNEAAQTVDLAFMTLLVAGLVVTIVLRLRNQDIRWRRAALIGIAGMALSFLAHLNQFPLSEFDYPTTDSYSSFVFSQMLQGLVAALGFGGLLFVLTAGAESVYREGLPNQISLGNLFRLRGLRTRRFFLGASLGISLTAIFIAYQTVFYITAQRFGAWSPADVPYSDLLNTRLPWLFVLFGGYFPAISEEFLFRMFAIPFLRKLLRFTVPAVVLAGFIWGFGHAGYPQQPFYIRGVEVGIGGVALGFQQHLVLRLKPGQRGRLAAEGLRAHAVGPLGQRDQLAPGVEHQVRLVRGVQIVVEHPPDRARVGASGLRLRRRLLGRVRPEQVVEGVPAGHRLHQQRRPHQVAQRRPAPPARGTPASDAAAARADVGARMQPEQPEHPRGGVRQVPVRQREHGPHVRGRIAHVERVEPPAELGQLRRQRGQRQPGRGGGPRDDDRQRERQPRAQGRQLGHGPRLGRRPRSAPSRSTSSSFASWADSTSSWTSSAPSRAASAASSRLLVTITRHSGDAGSSGRTCATSAALSSSTSIRRPASTDR